MDLVLLTVIGIVVVAMLFDYTNGFHDSAKRWRSSNVAASGSGWSVMKSWKRCPSASAKHSWAPG
jgi:hypothetical protein